MMCLRELHNNQLIRIFANADFSLIASFLSEGFWKSLQKCWFKRLKEEFKRLLNHRSFLCVSMICLTVESRPENQHLKACLIVQIVLLNGSAISYVQLYNNAQHLFPIYRKIFAFRQFVCILFGRWLHKTPDKDLVFMPWNGLQSPLYSVETIKRQKKHLEKIRRATFHDMERNTLKKL